MRTGLSIGRERELAWLNIVEAHASRLGLPDTVARIKAMRRTVEARWARSGLRFA